MSKTFYFAVFIVFILFSWAIELTVNLLRIKSTKSKLPEEFADSFDEDLQKKYTRYRRKNSLFAIFENSLFTFALLAFLIFGGFNFMDVFVRRFSSNEVLTGVLYFFCLFGLFSIFSIPFSWYSKFRIENEFGFNTTTTRTFVMDLAKGLLLSVLIGAPVSALIIWFFIAFGNLSWIIAWGALAVLQIFFVWIAPVVITPLFNKFSPVDDQELKDRIGEYAQRIKIDYKGIYKMDGSKRSTKPNAYFIGMGKTKRIVLFDTLIEKLDREEIVGVLAHEMGHYKKKHIFWSVFLMTAQSFLLFFLLFLLIKIPQPVNALGIEKFSIHAAMTAFAILYTPVSLILTAIGNYFSRKFEFQADKFAVETTGEENIFSQALKKIYISSFGDLSPHPFDVIVNYSHPPVLDRLKAAAKKTTPQSA